MKQCKGRIHSFESFSTQDGPGIRYVVFMQGCLARCLYCQNPDTWDIDSGSCFSAKDVFEKIERCLPYINSSGGGVTISGGEPLLQPDFLIELFKICKRHSIHTAIDTSAFYMSGADIKKIGSLIGLTDLFIMDIKAAENGLHRKITSRELSEVLFFIKRLEDKNKDYWLRYVLVPGLNDSEEDLKDLKTLLAGLKYCKKFEFLPYHTLGRHKWEYLNLSYPLDGFPCATPDDVKNAFTYLATNPAAA